SAGATVSVLTGAGGPRVIAAQLDNRSTIDISAPQGLTVNVASSAAVNRATINVTSGNLTLNLSGTSPSFSNLAGAIVSIASNRRWIVNNGSLDLTSGATSGPGTLDVNGTTLAFTTATMTAPLNLATTTISGGSVSIPSGQSLNLVGGTLAAT